MIDDNATRKGIYSQIEKLVAFKIHHLIFWLIYFFFWVYFYSDVYEDISVLYKVTGIYLVAHASIYYISQYVLVPKILKPKNAILFILSFIILAILTSFWMYGVLVYLMAFNLSEYFKASFFQVLVIFTLSNIFTSGILLAIKSFLDNRKLIRQSEQMEKEKLQTELQYLKSQVNPHFLFNTINSIYVLIRMDPEKASETLIKLSNLLRSQLYEFSVDRIDIQRELAYLENYIELEKIRKGDRLNLELNFEGELEDFQIAPLMLIPFLENCFKHISSYSDRPNIVKVFIRRIGDWLEADFYNTYEKESISQSDYIGGIGLANIKRRLDLIYPKRYKLEIKEGESDFTVNLKIKISGYEN